MNEELDGGASLTGPRMALGEPAQGVRSERDPVGGAQAGMLPLDNGELLSHLGGVMRKARRMPQVGEERAIDHGEGSPIRDADPHVPIREIAEIGIETTDLARDVRPDHRAGAAPGNSVVAEQLLGSSRRRRALSADDAQVLVDGERSHANPPRFGVALGCPELLLELVGRPEIVVVRERDPPTAGLLEASVASSGDPTGLHVA
jgi:hypothetical protein